MYGINYQQSVYMLVVLMHLAGSNPKRGNSKMGNKMDIHLCKSANAKKQWHSLPYVIVFSEYGMTNVSISSVALPLTANPKLVKKKRTPFLPRGCWQG